MSVPTLSVAELNAAIAGALANAFDDQVWVQGEIHSFSTSPAGHSYFRLVEPGTLGSPSEASINVVLFRGNKRSVDAVLAKAGALEIAEDMEVRIRGEVSFYAPTGRVQLRMTAIDPSHTLGRLAAERERLLRQLATEGLLTRNSLLALSPLPLRVGLITSADSAAAADFLNELSLSSFAWQVTLFDSQVQGHGSIPALTRALSQAGDGDFDVIAVVRGGGSRSDLATFDAEAIARMIAATPIPVITGIGHEIDESIADRVAYQAFKTPTAAAGFLIERVNDFRKQLDDLASLSASLALEALANQEDRIVRLGERASERANNALERAEAKIESLQRYVSALDPAKLLARGWSITRTADGELLRSVNELGEGSHIHTMLQDGTITSAIQTIERKTDG